MRLHCRARSQETGSLPVWNATSKRLSTVFCSSYRLQSVREAAISICMALLYVQVMGLKLALVGAHLLSYLSGLWFISQVLLSPVQSCLWTQSAHFWTVRLTTACVAQPSPYISRQSLRLPWSQTPLYSAVHLICRAFQYSVQTSVEDVGVSPVSSYLLFQQTLLALLAI